MNTAKNQYISAISYGLVETWFCFLSK